MRSDAGFGVLTPARSRLVRTLRVRTSPDSANYRWQAVGGVMASTPARPTA
jgi:hypothetical protein